MKTETTSTHESGRTADGEQDGIKTCYVRPVLAGEVRDEIARESTEELKLRDDSVLYALHAADGSRIALMSDREIAFAAAKQHEMVPVSVH